MGSPISSIVTNLFVEESETKATNTATNTPRLWRRYVDDTFVTQKTEHRTQILEHTDSVEIHIEPTHRGIYALSGHIAYTMTKQLSAIVYRKPTNADQYLHWDSCHNPSAKYSKFNILIHRQGLFVQTHFFYKRRKSILKGPTEVLISQLDI